MARRVDQHSPGYDEMARRWELPDALLGGTIGMQDAGEKYLPRMHKERADKYRARLSATTLLPRYRGALELAVDRPFAKPVTYEGELSPSMQRFWDDVDMTGQNVSAFARNWMFWGLHHGVAHVLLDQDTAAAPRTLAEQRAMGIRPVAVLIKAPQLIRWKHRTDPQYGLVLEEIAYWEDGEDADGKPAKQLRVIRASPEGGLWELWRTGSGGLAQVGGGSFAFPLPFVPLASFYAKPCDKPMLAEPAFEDLAWLNRQHWQSDSEQQELLSFARVGVWFAKGWQKAELQQGLTIGAHRFVGTENTDADLRVVEHSGAAIKSGADRGLELEARMDRVAMDTISRAPANVRATTAVIGERRQESQLGAWAASLGMSIRKMVELAAAWDTGERLSEQFQPRVYADFVVGLRGDADVGQLHQMRAAGDLSRQTYFEELQRRGFLSDIVTSEEEEDRLATEGMSIPETPDPEPDPIPPPVEETVAQ